MVDLSGPWPFLIVLSVLVGLMTWGVIYTRKIDREAEEAMRQERCPHLVQDLNEVTHEYVCRACGYRQSEEF